MSLGGALKASSYSLGLVVDAFGAPHPTFLAASEIAMVSVKVEFRELHYSPFPLASPSPVPFSPTPNTRQGNWKSNCEELDENPFFTPKPGSSF